MSKWVYDHFSPVFVPSMRFYFWIKIVSELHFSGLLSLAYIVEATKHVWFQAFSGVGESIQDKADVLQNTALSAALNTQFLFQIGIFTAVPMILGFILEQGFLKVASYRFCLSMLCIKFYWMLCAWVSRIYHHLLRHHHYHRSLIPSI